MLTLKQLLQSDSVSSMIDKLNTNFQLIAVSGGGPQGIRGSQGLPGLPGRIGRKGDTGGIGPTGTTVKIIPFVSSTGGTTGPTSGSASPWNANSYNYLKALGTTPISGDIYIDHSSRGFWQYKTGVDAGSTYTSSPYSNAGTTSAGPPTGSGSYVGANWYFYPMPSGITANNDNVWQNDETTYQLAPPYQVGIGSESLTISNARLISKYGTVWISSGNGIDSNNILTTPKLSDWGSTGASATSQARPGRYNAGIDRLYFKQSIDTLPFFSNVSARSYTGTVGLDPTVNATYPGTAGVQITGPSYWTKPLYSVTFDNYSPLQYFTERRTGVTNYGSLGLYMYSGTQNFTVDSKSYAKSLFTYSTRVAENPDELTAGYTGGAFPQIDYSNTFNISEMLFDVRRLTTSNQFVCSLPSDLYMSEEYVNSNTGTFNADPYVANTVTQGYVSTINGKAIAGTTGGVNSLNYGNGWYVSSTGPTGQSLTGNYTRSSWYGSAFYQDPATWSSRADSSNQANTTNTNTADRMYRLAGMKERGRKTWDGFGLTYFLNELIFYTAGFNNSSGGANIDSANLKGDDNKQNSYGALYVSPWRNFGIGTFTADKIGVFEPAARLHSIASVYSSDVEGTHIVPTVTGRGSTGNFSTYPSKVYKSAAFTAADGVVNTSKYIDVYLGETIPLASEFANPGRTSASFLNKSANLLDVAIRRESWNGLTGLTGNNASILRLGVSPTWSGTGSISIGTTASQVPQQFPFAISPLNPAGILGAATSPLGFGFHNVYPRARAHFFGKNSLNEGQRGNEPWSPGFNVKAGQTPSYTGASTGTYPFYPLNTSSAGQIVIDELINTYTYPAGIFEYPYEVYGVADANTNPDATGGTGSPNAANFPWRELAAPTRSVTPWGLTGRNFSYPSATGALNGAYKHGATGSEEGNTDDGNLFPVENYVGFNLFRDLLNAGDNADNTRWRTGSNLYDNGGAAILSNSLGDLAFTNIVSKRDGGDNFKGYEQQGLSTRDVVNNISLLISKRGDIGIGNRPGYDINAYGSLERNIDTGNVNYVPGANATATGPTGTPGWPYGLISYRSLSASYPETGTASAAAAINKFVTKAEHIKLEVGADKFYGKNSRSIVKAGYGYPPSATLSVTGTNITKYLLVSSGYTGAGNGLTGLSISTDFEGRVTNISISGSTAGDPRQYLSALIIPHPTEFNADSGTPWATAGFTAPAGACAPSLKPNSNDWGSNTMVGTSFALVTQQGFVQETIGTANIRLNNFVAGEGIHPNAGATAAVKTARQQSPKIILSFLEADSTKIPGSYGTTGTDRPISGTAAYRKVNTVIASAQNESAIREYWIPKADNTGGTFMVFTDHYGQKEKNSGGFDDVTIAANRFYVEEVVTLEFVPSYTGSNNEFITDVSGLTASMARGGSDYIGAQPWVEASYSATPLYVKYMNSYELGNGNRYGITGPNVLNYFEQNQYGRKVLVLGTGVTGTTPSTVLTGVTGGVTGGIPNNDAVYASILRNVDKYYGVKTSETNWDNGWGSSGSVNNKDSAFRFRRINSDFALVDFNMTVNVENPFVNGVTGGYTDLPNQVIDFGSPRWTQYVRLTYIPVNSGTNNNALMDQYGNGLSFMNWSSYNQWYPGTAIATDSSASPTLTNPGDSLTKTGGPQYTTKNDSNADNTLTWNGNFIDVGVTRGEGYGIGVTAGNQTLATTNTAIKDATTSDFYPFGPGISLTNPWTTATNAMPRFAGSYFQANISKMLVLIGNEKSLALSYRFGGAHSLFGNEWLSRSRSCMWRLVPRVGTYYGDGIPGGTEKNNSFTLEVMFDTPILHIDTPFPKINFASNSASDTCTPYKNLTLNGQAMVRYSDLTQTTATV
jgi:hypothetical protein